MDDIVVAGHAVEIKDTASREDVGSLKLAYM